VMWPRPAYAMRRTTSFGTPGSRCLRKKRLSQRNLPDFFPLNPLNPLRLFSEVHYVLRHAQLG
jgi:hypothetical protein